MDGRQKRTGLPWGSDPPKVFSGHFVPIPLYHKSAEKSLTAGEFVTFGFCQYLFVTVSKNTRFLSNGKEKAPIWEMMQKVVQNHEILLTKGGECDMIIE